MQHPISQSALNNHIAKIHHQLTSLPKSYFRYYKYKYKYGCFTPHPNKIIYVKPNGIKWARPRDQAYPQNGVSNQFKNEYKNYGILGGDWDLYKKPFWQEPTTKSIFQRFVLGYDWEDTSKYKNLRMRRRKQSMIDNYCKEKEKLFQSIKNNGYNDDFPIKIHIGRSGELIKHDGYHRIAICCILNINKIPAKVLIRHKKWQQIRGDMISSYTNHLNKLKYQNYIDHPDIDINSAKK